MIDTSEFLTFRTVGQLVLGLDSRHEQLMITDAIGSEIWQLSTAGHDEAGIVHRLQQRYEVEKHRLQADVRSFLARLAQSDAHIGEPTVGRQDKDVVHEAEALVFQRYYRFNGQRVCIAATSEAPLNTVDHFWSAFRETDSNNPNPEEPTVALRKQHGRWRVLHEGWVLHETSDPADAGIRAIYTVLHRLGFSGTWLARMHAAALVHPNGRALVLPASGGSGKTTLCAWLMNRGYALINDDVVTLRDSQGHLDSTPTPLSVKSGSWSVLASVLPGLLKQPVSEVDGRRCRLYMPRPPLQLAESGRSTVLVVPRYAADAGPARLEPLDAGHMITHLLSDGMSFPRPLTPSKLDELLCWLGRSACFQLRYQSLDEAAELIDSLLDSGAG